MKQVYKWCENVFIIDGFLRSCVYDLQRSSYEIISKESKNLISKIEGHSYSEIQQICSIEEMYWVDLFIQHEYILTIPETLFPFFPPIDTQFETPEIISNAIIATTNNLSTILGHLDNLGCKHIQLVVHSEQELLVVLKEHFEVTNFHSLSATINNLLLGNDELQRMCQEYPILSNILVNDNSVITGQFNGVSIFYSTNQKPKHPLFITKYETFFESEANHLYFNKKLFISEDGEIKNSPESEFIAGNIQNIKTTDDLVRLINLPDFKFNWAINKDRVLVCSDCEFRRMCFEKNQLIPLENGLFQLENECSYNPYIAKWDNEPGYQTLNQIGVVINNKGISIDRKNIEVINLELWDTQNN